MKKNYWGMLVLILGIVLIAGSVSALDLGFNQKDFNESNGPYGSINIKDWWGLGNDIAEYKLGNYEDSIINAWAEGEVKILSERSVFDGVKFEGVDGENKDLNEVKVYILTNVSEKIKTIGNDSQENCYDDINGTQICERNWDVIDKEVWNEVWKEYNGEKLSPGDYKWRLEGKKKKVNEKVDFILIAQGKELDEWAWWDNSWGKKKAINLYTTASSWNNYSVLINVTYDSDMYSNFSDVRFTDGTESLELGMWLQNKSDGAYANFWVNSSLIQNTNKTIYMYYSNPGATTTTSNAYNVFKDYNTLSITISSASEFETGRKGPQLETTSDIIIKAINKTGSETESTRAVISDGTHGAYNSGYISNPTNIYAQTNFSGKRADFNQPYAISSGVEFWLGTDANGTNYHSYAGDGNSYVYTRDGANWEASVNHNLNIRTDQPTGWMFSVEGFYYTKNSNALVYFGSEESSASMSTNLLFPGNNTFWNRSTLYFTGNVSSVGGLIPTNVSLKNNNTYYAVNTSGLLGIYNFTNVGLAEANNQNWTLEIYGNDSQRYTTNVLYYNVDRTNPILSNLAINQSGEIFGYPARFNISVNASDTNLAYCIGSVDGGSNETLNCNGSKDIGTLEEGNHTYLAWANDSAGNFGNGSNLSFSVDYYTHNVTFRDSFDNAILSPTSCLFENQNETGYEYRFDVHNTSARNVSCYLVGYDTFGFNLSNSNFTNQNVSVTPVMLNLTFDAVTNVSIIWLGGGLNFTNVQNVTIPMKNISTGIINVEFNGNTQLYSFNNDQDTGYSATLHLENVDFDQPVKVLAGNNEIPEALVTFKRVVNGISLTTYSAFTDVNGLVHIIVNDGNTYEVYANKEGYDNYSDLVYIPASNTETLIVNLLGGSSFAANYIFTPSCLSSIGTAQNCSFYVRSLSERNITYNYTWWGQNYSVTSLGSEANLTLVANASTTPIIVNVSVNPTRGYVVTYDALSNRSIQVNFDADEIKDEDNGIVVLFYVIVLIIGIMIMVTINRIPKMKGNGIYGLEAWFGLLAVQFPLLWFIVIVIGIYLIFKAIWGDDD